MPRPERIGVPQFAFQVYEPGVGPTGKPISFQAHIINFSLNSSPTWNEEFDMGRADPVMMYGSYNKGFTVSFIVVSTYQDDADLNYQDLNDLGMLTYPIYKGGRGYNAPHVSYIIGEYLNGIGVITSLDYQWDGAHPWVGEPPMPLITEVSLGIKVLTDGNGNRPKYKIGSKGYMRYD